MLLLDIQNLTHRFGGLTAVENFNMRIHNNEICGLIGPNGAGKTTIFNLVSGFYTPSQGLLEFDGKLLGGLKPHQISSMGIGRTFQNIRLWHDMTVLDNIRMAQHGKAGYSMFDIFSKSSKYLVREEEITEKALELLEIFGLQDQAEEFPKNLPYGVQRRIEIARALALNPKLLLLDEPAAGLSSADVVDLIDHIKWVHENFDVTIWMIEHQMQVVMTLCEKIKVIDFGKPIAEGTPDEIKNDKRVIEAYLGEDTEI